MKSSLCDYSDAYIPVKENITVTGAGADTPAKQEDERWKQVMCKCCASFTNYIPGINNTQIHYVKHVHVVIIIQKPSESL